MNYLYLLILLPLPVLLNRWSGTGDMFNITITGTMIYTLYFGLFITALSNIYYGLLVAILFLIGESYSFGKWVGFLVSPNGAIELENKAGTKFPFIHQAANFFIPQEKNYKRYCQLALSIRGLYWWTPIMIVLAYADLINWYMAFINSIILAIGFPISCEIGKNINCECNYKYFHTSRGWCNQEVVYGIIQFICITLTIGLSNV